jgi:putative flippase GtrA
MRKIINFFLELGFMKKLSQKFPIIEKVLNYETISYLFFGIMTTFISIISYLAAVYIISGNADEPTRPQIMTSNIISWVLAVSFAYITNKLWVFESKTTKLKAVLKEISAFIGARLFSLVFELAWMWILVTLFTAKYDDIYKLAAQFAIVIMNYIFSKLFIFNKES